MNLGILVGELVTRPNEARIKGMRAAVFVVRVDRTANRKAAQLDMVCFEREPIERLLGYGPGDIVFLKYEVSSYGAIGTKGDPVRVNRLIVREAQLVLERGIREVARWYRRSEEFRRICDTWIGGARALEGGPTQEELDRASVSRTGRGRRRR